MAIERIDDNPQDNKLDGWTWQCTHGGEETLLIRNDWLDLYSDDIEIHTITAKEIDYWLIALTKAKAHFKATGVLK